MKTRKQILNLKDLKDVQFLAFTASIKTRAQKELNTGTEHYEAEEAIIDVVNLIEQEYLRIRGIK